MTTPPIVACLVALLVAACTASPPPPSASSPVRVALTGPNAEEYGARNGYPIGDRNTFFQLPFLVGSFSHLDTIFQGRLVRRADVPSSLDRPPTEPALRYEYQGRSLDLDQYLASNPTTGILIARNDRILIERYQYARNDRHRFTSQSMAKTVTSMLIGIAIAEGRIRSVDDPAAAYAPGLAGTAYGRTSLRHLLQMSSGVRFLEEYSGRDDVRRLANDTFFLNGPGGVGAVTRFNERAAPSGTRFVYSTDDDGRSAHHRLESPAASLTRTRPRGTPAPRRPPGCR